MYQIKIQTLHFLESIVGQTITNATLILDSPIEYTEIDLASISINLQTEKTTSFTITTSANLWTLEINFEEKNNSFPFSEFWDFIKNSDVNNFDNFHLFPINFSLNESDVFSIFNEKIQDIKILNIDNGIFNPHGIIIYFKNDLLISSCGHDGNIIQSKNFLKELNLLDSLSWLGKTKFLSLREAIEMLKD